MVGAPIYPIGNPLKGINAGFGTDGIRGHVGTELTSSFAHWIGYLFGKTISSNGPVLIGRDSRNSGEMLTSALTAGLNAAGHEVWLLGLCPTPAVQMLIPKLGASGGLMVSASHNPPEDNGIKFFGANGAKLKEAQQNAIQSALTESIPHGQNFHSFSTCARSHDRSETLNCYQEELLSTVGTKRLDGISIILDLCWGSATKCTQEVFSSLGADIHVIHGQPDGSRINVKCGSTDLNPLRKAVIENNAEMGFAFDGDADRMLAVDGQGRIIDGDHALYLWGTALQEQQKLPDNKLVSTVMSNLGFEKAWVDRGGVLERTAVGDQNVHAAMLASGAALGGEQSGHLLAASNGFYGDGIHSALQLATLCKTKNLTLAQWLNQSFQPFPQKLVNVNVPNPSIRKSWDKCQPLQEAVMDAEASMGSEGRVLVRASGTEPLLRVMVEASDPEAVESWTSQLVVLAETHLKAA